MKIIADIGASHGGKLKNALALIDAAEDSGADMVKVQCYLPDDLEKKRRPKLGAIITWQGKPTHLIDLYRDACTPQEWFKPMFAYAKSKGIVLFSSVFDLDAVRFLEKFNCPAYKVSSYEGDDMALIERARATGKPVIVSNPVAPIPMDFSVPHVSVLHCVSKYPCPDDEAELDRITELKRTYPIVGFSDHTLGTLAALKAKAMGARVFEKHIKLEGDTTSPDSGFAITPKAFAEYVAALRA